MSWCQAFKSSKCRASSAPSLPWMLPQIQRQGYVQPSGARQNAFEIFGTDLRLMLRW